MSKDVSPYINFLENSFPKCPVKKEKIIESIYEKICENNMLTDIFTPRIIKKYPKSQIEFLQLYKKQLNKILIYIGLNEEDGLNFCFRSCIEYLLKFIYSIQTVNNFSTINNINYRHLSESLKDEENQIYPNIKIDINNFFDYYGKFSNSVHGKTQKTKNEIIYLEQIISFKHINYSKVYNYMSNILNSYEKVMQNILKITSKNLSASEILRCKEIMKNNKFNKLFKDNN